MDMESFEKLLDRHHNWPCPYTFKFVIPLDKEDELRQCLNDFRIESKASARGNYLSLTIRPVMGSSKEVIEVYQRVQHIEGLIAL